MARLSTLGGVARRSELVRTAADRRALAAAVTSGAVREVGDGWLAVLDTAPELIVARRVRGTVTCASAASYYGLQQLTEPDHPHVAVPRRRGIAARPAPLRAVVHRENGWTRPADPALPVAPVVEVLTRVLRCLPAPDAIVMVDSALNKGLIADEEISRALAGPGSPRARATLERCDPRSRSAIETLARLALRETGLQVIAGARIDGVGEVDLLVEERVVVECDGYAYHSGRHEYQEDRRRDRALVARGYLVLRFTAAEITHTPELVVAAVQQVLSR